MTYTSWMYPTPYLIHKLFPIKGGGLMATTCLQAPLASRRYWYVRRTLTDTKLEVLRSHRVTRVDVLSRWVHSPFTYPCVSYYFIRKTKSKTTTSTPISFPFEELLRWILVFYLTLPFYGNKSGWPSHRSQLRDNLVNVKRVRKSEPRKRTVDREVSFSWTPPEKKNYSARSSIRPFNTVLYRVLEESGTYFLSP